MYTVTRINLLQVVVLLRALLYSIVEYSSTVSLFQTTFARGQLHWTPCRAPGGTYQWRPDGIGGPKKGHRETRGRSHWRVKEIHNSGNGKRIFFIQGGIVSFWGIGPECRMGREGCNRCSQRNPVLLCHLWWQKESSDPDIAGSFFQKGR